MLISGPVLSTVTVRVTVVVPSVAVTVCSPSATVVVSQSNAVAEKASWGRWKEAST